MREARGALVIVGLRGDAGCGKDTVASILVERHGFRLVKFADGLRACLLALDPIVDASGFSPPVRLSAAVAEREWDGAKARYVEVRELLQRMGTEVGRNVIDPDLWVNLAVRDIERGGDVVVSDVRFPNEVQAIRNRGGVVALVRRPGTRDPSQAWRQHVSESALAGDVPDAVLQNDGTLDELAERTCAFLAAVKGRAAA